MNLRAKKSLGQNFLKNNKILEKMVEAGKVANEIVLEVGPGKGALTKYLLAEAKKVVAVEKDHRMIGFLEEKFASEIEEKKLILIEGDILDFNFEKDFDLKKEKYILMANLPYYITGKFLNKVFTEEVAPKKIILLLQKEIVERITGEERRNGKIYQNPKESILSLSVKLYAKKVKYLITVGRKNFSPAPNVDSAVILISGISDEFFKKNKIKEKDFFAFLKLVFNNKRKKM